MSRLDVAVIEDDDAIRDLILETLSEEDYTVLGIPFGRDVVPVLAGSPPRLILLDRHLGDCDAREVLETLRQTPYLGAIPVVLISASATVETEAAALETEGALAKPFRLEALSACVAAFLSPARASRAVGEG